MASDHDCDLFEDEFGCSICVKRAYGRAAEGSTADKTECEWCHKLLPCRPHKVWDAQDRFMLCDGCIAKDAAEASEAFGPESDYDRDDYADEEDDSYDQWLAQKAAQNRANQLDRGHPSYWRSRGHSQITAALRAARVRQWRELASHD